MLKRKDMKRSEWRRILQKEYQYAECSFEGKRGIASILVLQRVTEPLTVCYDHGHVTIANEGDTWLQLAFENSCYWVTAMYNSKNELIQIYFDITNGNCLEPEDNPAFEDLYLDLVLEADGTLHVLDRDELDDALKRDVISQEQHCSAVDTCEWLYSYLRENWMDFTRFCRLQMLELKQDL